MGMESAHAEAEVCSEFRGVLLRVCCEARVYWISGHRGAAATTWRGWLRRPGPTCKRLANRSTRFRRGQGTGGRAPRVSGTFLAYGGGGCGSGVIWAERGSLGPRVVEVFFFFFFFSFDFFLFKFPNSKFEFDPEFQNSYLNSNMHIQKSNMVQL